MIDENRLPAVRREIRRFIVLPDEEPIDIVLLATFLFALLPKRDVTIWLVLITTGEIAAELVELVIDHPLALALPDRLTTSYLGGDRRMTKRRSRGALPEVDASGKRVLVARMAALTEMRPQFRCDLFGQLLAVHDGHLRTEAGPEQWGPKAPAERPGWIGAATISFYDFLENARRRGNPFLVYCMDRRRHWHWSDDLEADLVVHQTNQEARRIAKEVVQGFLSSSAEKLGEFDSVTITEGQRRRIGGAAALVSRVIGVEADSSQVYQVSELCRMFAFLVGQAGVSEADVDLGIRIVFSQLPLAERTALEFIVSHVEDAWTIGELARAADLTRKVVDRLVERLKNLEIISRARKPKEAPPAVQFYAATDHAIRLIRMFVPVF